MEDIFRSFLLLKNYCEKEHFKGWDPYDGLNSKVLQVVPFLEKSALCRLIIIQCFKRCPVNLRYIACVPKGYNAKGIGLFLSGYCNLYHIIAKNPDLELQLGNKTDILNRIQELADLLIQLQSTGYSGACWGYNFDWQSRAFFLPKYTPTVVATSFVVEALLCAYEITNNRRYLETAISAGDFITKDLNKIPKANEHMFSYSPLDDRAVYNATLLGSKTLALLYHYTNNMCFLTEARASVAAVCAQQNSDGSFPHSDQVGNKWRDNFHTGFKLESLAIYSYYCHDHNFDQNIINGYNYWINNFFFKEKGVAKYYDNSSVNSIIDLHCVAQAIPTLYKLNKLKDNQDLCYRLLMWAIKNMQSYRGYFFFQKKGRHLNKIAYMRWPNAWMFYGMSYWLRFKHADK